MKRENADYLWLLRNNLDIHSDKSIKDLKYASEGWAFQELERDTPRPDLDTYETWLDGINRLTR